MKFRITLFATLAATLLTSALWAQSLPLQELSTEELQGRFRAGIEIPIGKKWEFEWSEQVRLKNNFNDLDKIVSSAGIGFKANKYLRLGFEYGLANERDDDNGKWRILHRLNFDVTGKYRIGRVKLSLRERVRLQFRNDSVNKYEHPDPFATLRSRFTVAYDIFNSRWEPYAFVELYTTLNAPAPVANFRNEPLTRDNYINRIRLAVGTEYKINKKHRIDIHYMLHLNRSYDARYKAKSGDMKEWSLEKNCAHVICLDYKFKL